MVEVARILSKSTVVVQDTATNIVKIKGSIGPQGGKGDTGNDGLSAYESALLGGMSPTVTENDFYLDLAAMQGLNGILSNIVDGGW